MLNSEFWVDLWAGWVGGAASVLVVQPVDTTLTRLQAARLTPGGVGGVSARGMFQRVMAEGGARALWRGSAPMAAVVPIQNALLFAGYGAGERWAKALQTEEHAAAAAAGGAGDSDGSSSDGGSAHATPSLLPVFAGGCAGGVLQSFVVSPIELIKIRQQWEGGGVSAAARTLASRLGSGVLWRGLVGQVARTAVHIPSYSRPSLRTLGSIHWKASPLIFSFLSSRDALRRSSGSHRALGDKKDF